MSTRKNMIFEEYNLHKEILGKMTILCRSSIWYSSGEGKGGAKSCNQRVLNDFIEDQAPPPHPNPPSPVSKLDWRHQED